MHKIYFYFRFAVINTKHILRNDLLSKTWGLFKPSYLILIVLYHISLDRWKICTKAPTRQPEKPGRFSTVPRLPTISQRVERAEASSLTSQIAFQCKENVRIFLLYQKGRAVLSQSSNSWGSLCARQVA